MGLTFLADQNEPGFLFHSELEEWRQRGLAGIDAGLRERDDDPQERALAEARFTASAR